MSGIINDEILLEIAKEELLKHANSHNEAGLLMGDVYAERINGVYNLLVKFMGNPI